MLGLLKDTGPWRWRKTMQMCVSTGSSMGIQIDVSRHAREWRYESLGTLQYFVCLRAHDQCARLERKRFPLRGAPVFKTGWPRECRGKTLTPGDVSFCLSLRKWTCAATVAFAKKAAEVPAHALRRGATPFFPHAYTPMPLRTTAQSNDYTPSPLPCKASGKDGTALIRPNSRKCLGRWK